MAATYNKKCLMLHESQSLYSVLIVHVLIDYMQPYVAHIYLYYMVHQLHVFEPEVSMTKFIKMSNESSCHVALGSVGKLKNN